MRRLHRIAAVVLCLAGAGPASAATLTVGPGKMYARPCQAIAAAHAGDLILVDAGAYNGDTCAWSTDNLTVRGVGGRARIDLTGVTPAQQKGIFTIAAPTATVENFELSGAAISAAAGNNGAGIRHQGLDLTVRNCYFHDNQDGILGAPSTALRGTVLIESSEFAHNGAGDGFSHNMYLGNYASFTLQYSYTHHGNVGHLYKSRALVSNVLYNRITDEVGGSASYEIDLPNGGTGYVIGNIVEQSATTQNPAIITFAEEGVPAGYDTQLFVAGNTIVNDRGSGTFVVDKAQTAAVIIDNIFYNGGTITGQANAMLISNFDASAMGDPKFADLPNYDVHLLAGSPCIDAGTLPAPWLTPELEYVHPLAAETRAIVGAAIDIGAYESGNTGTPAPDGGVIPSMDAGVADLSNAITPDLSQAIAPDLAQTMTADLTESIAPDLAQTMAADLSSSGAMDASVGAAADLSEPPAGTPPGGCTCGIGAGARRNGSPLPSLALILIGIVLTGALRMRCSRRPG